MTDHDNRSTFEHNEVSDWMLAYRFQVDQETNIAAYRYSRYPKTYCQYGSYDTQRTAKETHEILKKEFPFMTFNAIVIVRTGYISGAAGYNHGTDNLFVREELSDPVKFEKLVDKTYFPARNLHDVIMHEVGGHKRHWESVQSFYNQNQNQFRNLDDAKNNLEHNLMRYVKEKNYEDSEWIRKTVSENASESFKYFKTPVNRLNELIADAIVLKSQKKLKDERLWKLIEEVISYDD